MKGLRKYSLLLSKELIASQQFKKYGETLQSSVEKRLCSLFFIGERLCSLFSRRETLQSLRREACSARRSSCSDFAARETDLGLRGTAPYIPGSARSRTFAHALGWWWGYVASCRFAKFRRVSRTYGDLRDRSVCYRRVGDSRSFVNFAKSREFREVS